MCSSSRCLLFDGGCEDRIGVTVDIANFSLFNVKQEFMDGICEIFLVLGVPLRTTDLCSRRLTI